MAREKPFCESSAQFLRARLNDRSALAPLTGQDSRALAAFVHLVALYGNSDGEGRRAARQAMHHVVQAMQPSTRYFAKAVIPHVLDWSDEERIWQEIQ